MMITAKMINDILKRIRDYCKNNDYCGASAPHTKFDFVMRFPYDDYCQNDK